MTVQKRTQCVNSPSWPAAPSLQRLPHLPFCECALTPGTSRVGFSGCPDPGETSTGNESRNFPPDEYIGPPFTHPARFRNYLLALLLHSFLLLDTPPLNVL